MAESAPRPRTPRQVLARYLRAMRNKSADDLADLYAAGAVHDFPFRFPGMPERYRGREEVRAGYRAAWAATPVELSQIREAVVHDGDDPEVVVAEWAATGRVTTTGAPFELNGVLMFRVRDGLIVECRDYMNGMAISQILGRLPDFRGG
jgi:ketosteroid isomerase-like protein